MWRPEEWTDLVDLIGVRAESATLDFKRDLPAQGHEFPKDIAAISKDGGVILYGVVEDKVSRVASEITPVQIAGAEERIRNATKGVEPRLQFDVEVLRESAGATTGVIAVIVPPSPNWPHMVNGRFPARDGTTTRYLTHAEVAAALSSTSRGAATTAPPARPADLFDPVTQRLPGIMPVRVRSVFHGHAQIRVAVQPVSRSFAHPSGAWLGEALDEALAETAKSGETTIDARWCPVFLERLDGWKAESTDSWVGGFAGGDEGTLAQHHRASAVFVYETGHLLMEVTRPTEVRGDAGQLGYLCAFEPYVAAEVWAMLNFAGRLFCAAPDAGALNAGLHLAGFGGCVSHHATHADSVMTGRTSHLPTAPPYLMRAVTTSAQDLTEHTDGIARQLLDPWLPPFYEDSTPLYDKVLRQPRV